MQSIDHYFSSRHDEATREYYATCLAEGGYIGWEDSLESEPVAFMVACQPEGRIRTQAAFILARMMKRYRSRPTVWTCVVCDAQVNTKETAKIHFDGIPHQKKLKNVSEKNHMNSHLYLMQLLKMRQELMTKPQTRQEYVKMQNQRLALKEQKLQKSLKARKYGASTGTGAFAYGVSYPCFTADILLRTSLITANNIARWSWFKSRRRSSCCAGRIKPHTDETVDS